MRQNIPRGATPPALARLYGISVATYVRLSTLVLDRTAGDIEQLSDHVRALVLEETRALIYRHMKQPNHDVQPRPDTAYPAKNRPRQPTSDKKKRE